MSQVPALIDALVTLWRPDPGLEGVQVTDGPLVTESNARDWVTVGYTGDEAGDFEAASTGEDWADLGTSRAEEIQLTVGIVVVRGNNEVKASRDRAYEILAVLRASLRVAPSAGVPQTQIGIAASRLHEEPTKVGARARLVLTLVAQTFA